MPMQSATNIHQASGSDVKVEGKKALSECVSGFTLTHSDHGFKEMCKLIPQQTSASWLAVWWTWYSWGHSWPVAALHREPLKKKMTNKGQETETLLICWLMLGIVLHLCLFTMCLPTVFFVLCLCCRHLHSIDLKAIRDLRRQAEHSSLL